MAQLNLQAPWVEYANGIRVLFEKDPESSTEKAEALDQILEHEVSFGNVVLTVNVKPANASERTIDVVK